MAASRKSRAKQVLALDGDRTMIQQTLERLLPVADAGDVWVVTNELLAAQICGQLPEVPQKQILSEPAARNTAPACAACGVSAGEVAAGYGARDLSFGPCGERRGAITEVLRAGIALAARGETIVVLA